MSEAREYLIRKGAYYYRPNSQGYTTRKVDAGRYTKAEADAEASVEPWHMSAIHQDEIPDEPEIIDRDKRIEAAEADKARLSEEVRTILKSVLYHFGPEGAQKVTSDCLSARAALSGSGSGWREITEDDRPPNDVEVLMGCWESWPRNQWVVEYGLYGSTKGGWIHGRMTHWLPSSYLPAAPQQGRE